MAYIWDQENWICENHWYNINTMTSTSNIFEIILGHLKTFWNRLCTFVARYKSFIFFMAKGLNTCHFVENLFLKSSYFKGHININPILWKERLKHNVMTHVQCSGLSGIFWIATNFHIQKNKINENTQKNWTSVKYKFWKSKL